MKFSSRWLVPSFFCLAFLLFFPAVVHAGEAASPPSVTADFEGPFSPVDFQSPTTSISGEVPRPFIDNSGWTELKLHYSRETERPFSGKSALRLTVNDVLKGWAQLCLPEVVLDSTHFIKLSVAMMAPSSMQVVIYFRKKDYPYTTYWAERISVSPEWKTYQVLLPPIADDPHAMLTITTSVAGSLLIDDFSLTYVPKSELAASEPKTGNLVPQSSFPLGLTGQWSLMHGDPGVCVAISDENQIGPTGIRALGIGVGGQAEPYEPMSALLQTPPIILNPGRVHTVSFYAKGSQEGQVIYASISDPTFSKTAQSKKFTLTKDWKRYVMTGEIPYSIRGYYTLRIGAKELCWLDGISIEEKDTASEFFRGKPVEIAVKPVRPYGLSIGAEPLEYEYCVYGAIAPGMKLQAQLTGMDGKTADLAPIDLSASSLLAGSVTVPSDLTQKLGFYRLELNVFDSKGKCVTRPAELLLHRVNHPRMEGKDAPDSPFGIHISPTKGRIELAKNLGFNWVRLHDGGERVTGWYFVEKSPDQFDFSYSDPVVSLLRDNHLMVLGMLNMAPSFYTDMPKDYDGRHHTKQYFVVKDEYRGKWRTYCEKIVSRYRGKIDYWEVLNEPYAGNDFFIKTAVKDEKTGAFKVTLGTPENYVQLLEDAWGAAKRANPGATILGMMNNESGWNDLAIKAGAAKFCDIFSYHYYLLDNPFKGYPDSRIMRLFSKRFSEDFQSVAEKKPFWNTEGSTVNLQVPWVHNPAFVPGECDRMSNALTRSYLAFLVSGTKKWFVYATHAWGTWAPGTYSFIAPDESLAPSASAMSAMMGLIEGKTFLKGCQVSDQCTAFVFAGGDRPTVAVISNSNQATILSNIPEKWEVFDLYGNHVDGQKAQISENTVIYLVPPHRDFDLLEKELADLSLRKNG